MSFWIRYRLLAILMLFSGGPYVFFMVVLPIWELPFEVVVDKVWYRWQALNAGALALLGATLILLTHHQTDTAQRLEQAQKNRRHWAKAFEPIEKFIDQLRKDTWVAAGGYDEEAKRFSFRERLSQLGALKEVLTTEFSEEAYENIYEYLKDVMIDIHLLRNEENIGLLAQIGNLGALGRLEQLQAYLDNLRFEGVYRNPELPNFEPRVTPDDIF